MEDGTSGLVGVGGLDLKGIMISSGLIAEKEKGSYCITQAGFRFLLSDTHTQVWGILQEYIKHAESFRSSNLFDMLIEFILQLGFQRDCMSMQDFSPEKKEISSDLCRLGLLYPFQKGADVYLVPTRLAPTLFDYISERSELERRAADLFRWIVAGDLDVRIGHRFDLADAASAHDAIEGRATTGKVLLLP